MQSAYSENFFFKFIISTYYSVIISRGVNPCGKNSGKNLSLHLLTAQWIGLKSNFEGSQYCKKYYSSNALIVIKNNNNPTDLILIF